MDEQERGYGVHGEGALEILAPKLLERRTRERTAREDDVVDGAASKADAVDDFVDGRGPREVGAHRLGSLDPGVGRDGLGGQNELVRVPRREDRDVTAPRERRRDRDPEPARRADDEDLPPELALPSRASVHDEHIQERRALLEEWPFEDDRTAIRG